MIKVYYLPVERLGNSDTVKGAEHIHHALLTYGVTPNTALLVQDTTPEEDAALGAIALEVRQPTEQERVRLEAMPPPSPPRRNLATEIDEIKARVEKLENKKG